MACLAHGQTALVKFFLGALEHVESCRWCAAWEAVAVLLRRWKVCKQIEQAFQSNDAKHAFTAVCGFDAVFVVVLFRRVRVGGMDE